MRHHINEGFDPRVDPRVEALREALHDGRHERRQHHRGGPPFGGRDGFGRGAGGRDGFRRGGGRRGPRVGRGDIRAAVIALLNEEPMHGYQIIRELGERSGGVWRPSPGSIYPMLQLLQDEGLVTVDESGERRVFTLTDSGKAVAAEAKDSPAPWEAAAKGEPPAMLKLAEVTHQVHIAAEQVASAGTEDQVKQAIDALSKVRRDLYRMLAEDVPEVPTSEA